MKKTAFYLLLATLVFSPLAFGTVETWSYLMMEAMICISALLLIASSRGTTFRRVPGLLPLTLLNAFLFLQLLPLPATFVEFASPATHALHARSAGLTGNLGWIPLSIYPRATLMELLRFSSYALFYIITVQFFSNGRFLQKTVSLITGFAAILSLVAIIEFITKTFGYPLPHNKILWFRELSHDSAPMGPYVNRNHYAGLMAMILPLVIAMFLAYRPMITRISFKRRIADFFIHKRINHHLFHGAAAILIATSILLSLSRGGILSLCLSMVLFSALIILRVKQKKAGFFIGFIVIAVIISTGASGWEAVFKRFEGIRNQPEILHDNRLIIWHDSLGIIRDFPLVGTGAGTFEKIYPLYRTFPGYDFLEHAHNDYLEFFCTGGIVLPVLMAWTLFAILFSATRSFMKRREWYSVFLFIGCVTSITAMLLHSTVDFNMQIGANGLYFFFLLALAVSSANTRLRTESSPTYLEKSTVPRLFAGTVVLVLFATVICVHGGALIAHHSFSAYRNVALGSDTPRNTLLSIHRTARTSVVLDILNPIYSNIAANTASLLSNDVEALKYYAHSVRMAPVGTRYLTDAASFLHRRGNSDLAETLYIAGIHHDKTNMAAYIQYAAMLFDTNQTEKGLGVLKQAISIDTRITDACLSLMVLQQIHEDRMFLALPDRVEPHLKLGDFFNSLGEKPKAEANYIRALDFLPNEDKIEKNFFLRVMSFYRRNHMDEKALQIAQKAIANFPDDDGLRRAAGDLYKKLGIDYRAEEEYRKADLLKQPHQR